ncbi:MAG: hypothetical protein BJ554DRAFT_874 [Olpidium bornovanus]|uniref:Uncharacterized protein n=1 Tax=Olpidium bornovanus TaxID=278681 RepID=A0A8H8DHT9_9FUNG|nr:MAG: hypothetical protein BJ554DRAFT_874 [Olpidium bornovanus]
MAPLIKAAATSCALFAAGDFISQALVEKVTPYDARRTARFATVGALLHGPYFRLCRYSARREAGRKFRGRREDEETGVVRCRFAISSPWQPCSKLSLTFLGLLPCHKNKKGFDRLDKTFPAKTVTSVLAKSATAQLLVFPPYLCGFFIASALLEGKSFQSGVERVKTSIWKTFVAGSLVWPVKFPRAADSPLTEKESRTANAALAERVPGAADAATMSAAVAANRMETLTAKAWKRLETLTREREEGRREGHAQLVAQKAQTDKLTSHLEKVVLNQVMSTASRQTGTAPRGPSNNQDEDDIEPAVRSVTLVRGIFPGHVRQEPR